MSIVTILLLDNQKLVREAWAFMLNAVEGFSVVAQTGDAADAIRLAVKHKPRVIITDTGFGGNGFAIAEKMAKFSPSAAIIGLSSHSLPVYAKRIMKAGAMAFVTKNSSGEELIEAVEAVQSGQQFICREVKQLTEKAEREKANGKNPAVKLVSGRELDVMQLIRDGLSSKEIAGKLSITEKTVQVHRYNILKKLKLKNAAALVNYMNHHLAL